MTDEVQRPRLLVGGLTLLAFLSGAAGGAITTHMLEQRVGAAVAEPKTATPPAEAQKPQREPGGDREHPRGGRPRGGPRGGPHDPMSRLVRELKLTEEETAKVRAVYESQRAAFDAVFQEFRPKMEQVRKETNDAVRGVLPLEKQEAFDKLITEEEKRRETRGGEREREREQR